MKEALNCYKEQLREHNKDSRWERRAPLELGEGGHTRCATWT